MKKDTRMFQKGEKIFAFDILIPDSQRYAKSKELKHSKKKMHLPRIFSG